jgi:hypothetical protein
MVSKRQATHLRRIADARSRLLQAISGLDEGVLSTEPVVGHWTTKDLFGHIVSWNHEFRTAIRMILQGHHPGYYRCISGEDDFDSWNQRMIERKRNWTWRRMLADFHQDHDSAVRLIGRLASPDFRRQGVTPWKPAAKVGPAAPSTADMDSVETLVSYHWRHMNQHARMIEDWRKRRK